MNDLTKSLFKGKSIIIPRSDGRTNFATISAVDFDTQTVTVEWFENNEGKGKEILFADVFAQNPHLNLQNISSFETTTNLDPKSEEFTMKVKPQLPNNINNRTLKPKGYINELNTKRTLGNSEKLKAERPINITSNLMLTKNKSRMSSALLPSYSDPTVSKRHGRTSVVVEVEKLKKNREERRLKQAEAREEQKFLMSIYPKNPNWKFAKMINDYQATLEFTPITGKEIVEHHQITVCVRKRPLNKKELSKNEIDVISVPKKDLIIVHEPKNKVDLTKYLENQHFYFDYVFDDNCTNDIVYKFTAKPLIETIFEGGMATCFAYGQTGSGKTHTMGGNFSGKKQDLEKGIYIMAARDVFDYLNSPRYHQNKFIVSSTFFEIYQGKVYDLLAKKAKLRVLEDGKQQVQVVGLTEKVITSLESVLSLLKLGNATRTSGKTAANSNSSRSHAVFQIILRSSKSKAVYGKFSLIDLAGNERGADTSTANRITQMEGAEINKSLLALKECIRALGRKGAHLPFRQSKLTQVLRDSFVGEKSRTCMIAMISPGMCSCEHTLNTLRYADRVKELMSNDTVEKDIIQAENSKDLFNIKPLWNDLKEELKVAFDESDIQEDLMVVKDLMDVRFTPDISCTFTELANQQESTNKNIIHQVQQQT